MTVERDPMTVKPENNPEVLCHEMNCSWFDVERGCTCSLDWRIKLQTEQTMHAAWRKRAEEAEAENRRLESDLKEAVEALRWMSNKRALTIFIEKAEHVANFFEKADAVLAKHPTL